MLVGVLGIPERSKSSRIRAEVNKEPIDMEVGYSIWHGPTEYFVKRKRPFHLSFFTFHFSLFFFYLALSSMYVMRAGLNEAATQLEHLSSLGNKGNRPKP